MLWDQRNYPRQTTTVWLPKNHPIGNSNPSNPNTPKSKDPGPKMLDIYQIFNHRQP